MTVFKCLNPKCDAIIDDRTYRCSAFNFTKDPLEEIHFRDLNYVPDLQKICNQLGFKVRMVKDDVIGLNDSQDYYAELVLPSGSFSTHILALADLQDRIIEILTKIVQSNK